MGGLGGLLYGGAFLRSAGGGLVVNEISQTD